MTKIVDFIIDSINASRERLKLTVASFYIGLLALYHWKALAILFFGNVPMLEKIDEIDEIYFNWTNWNYILNLLLVLFTATLFMVLFPTIMWLSEKVLVKLSINRKRNKALEEESDRTDEIESVRHQFKLKQEETGNLQENEYLDRISRLEKHNSDLLKEIDNLRLELEQQRIHEKESVISLKESFKGVEQNYRLQLEELKRQNVFINEKNSEQNQLIFYKKEALTNKDLDLINFINNVYRDMSIAEKKMITKMFASNNSVKNVMTMFNDLSASIRMFLTKLQDLQIIKLMNFTNESFEILVLDREFIYIPKFNI